MLVRRRKDSARGCVLRGACGVAVLVVAAAALPLGTASAQAVPGTLDGLTLGSSAPAELTVTWDVPGEAPSDYRLNWAPASEPYPSWRSPSGNVYPPQDATSHTLRGLEEGVDYKVRLRARYRSGGDRGGPWSGPWSEATGTVQAAAATEDSDDEGVGEDSHLYQNRPEPGEEANEWINVGPPVFVGPPEQDDDPADDEDDALVSARSVEDGVLVSNAGQGAVSSTAFSGLESRMAQRFTTGHSIDGSAFKFSSIDLYLGSPTNAVPPVAVHADDGGAIGAKVYDLQADAVGDTADTAARYTAANGAELASGTTYWVQVTTTTNLTLGATYSNAEDSNRWSRDWAIKDTLDRLGGQGGNAWADDPAGLALRMSVYGEHESSAFTRTEFVPIVPEDVPVGRVINRGFDTVIDVQEWAKEHPLVFSIVEEDVPFAVNPTTGAVTVAQPLNYEDLNPLVGTIEFTLQVVVGRDTPSVSTATVSVFVTNKDDDGTISFDGAPAIGVSYAAVFDDEDAHAPTTPNSHNETYQWSRADSPTGTFSDIAAATSGSYTPRYEDHGKYLRVTVSYTDLHNAGGTTADAVAQSPVRSAPDPSAPYFFPLRTADEAFEVVVAEGVSGAEVFALDDDGTMIADLFAARDDNLDTLSYYIDGGGAVFFRADRGTGRLSTAAALDYEHIGRHTFDVTVRDPGGGTQTRPVVVTVVNADEPGAASMSQETPRVGTIVYGGITDPDGQPRNVHGQWHVSDSRTGPFTRVNRRAAGSVLNSFGAFTPIDSEIGKYLKYSATYRDVTNPAGASPAADPHSVEAVSQDPIQPPGLLMGNVLQRRDGSQQITWNQFMAQKFSTGSDSRGYTLTRVAVEVAELGPCPDDAELEFGPPPEDSELIEELRLNPEFELDRGPDCPSGNLWGTISLPSDSDPDVPGEVIHRFTAGIGEAGLLTFTVDGWDSYNLEPRTDYFLTLTANGPADIMFTSRHGPYKIGVTDAGGVEDRGTLSGWSLQPGYSQSSASKGKSPGDPGLAWSQAETSKNLLVSLYGHGGKTPHVVATVSDSGTDPQQGRYIDAVFEFNQNVRVSGTPTAILSGPAGVRGMLPTFSTADDRMFAYLSGSGTSELRFRYWLQPGDDFRDLLFEYRPRALLHNPGGSITAEYRDVSANLHVPGREETVPVGVQHSHDTGCNEVYCSNIRPAASDGRTGYFLTGSTRHGALDAESEFEAQGSDYRIEQLFHIDGGGLVLVLNPRPSAEMRQRFLLEVGAAAFRFSAGAISGTRITWADADQNWPLNGPVAFKIKDSVNDPPVGLPVITGTPQIGFTLTADAAGIEDDNGTDNAEFSYQWYSMFRGFSLRIAGAVEREYTVVSEDIGLPLKVEVSYVDDEGHRETVRSEATAAVVANAPPAFAKESYAFTIAENSPIGTVAGRVVATDDRGDNVTYTLAGARSHNFRLGAQNGNNKNRIETATTLDYETASTYRLFVTARDAQIPPATSVVPVDVTVTNVDEPGVITFTTDVPRRGEPVAAILRDPDGDISALTWQWCRQRISPPEMCTDINGATTRTYTPTATDNDHHLRATARYTDGHGDNKTAARTVGTAILSPDGHLEIRATCSGPALSAVSPGDVVVVCTDTLDSTYGFSIDYDCDPDCTAAQIERQRTGIVYQWRIIDKHGDLLEGPLSFPPALAIVPISNPFTGILDEIVTCPAIDGITESCPLAGLATIDGFIDFRVPSVPTDQQYWLVIAVMWQDSRGHVHGQALGVIIE